MIQKEVTVNMSAGLMSQSRPFMFLIQTANKFKSLIWIEKDGNRADAKSLLDILSLGIKNGSKLMIIVDGTDEQQAVAELVQLAEEFGNG